MWNNQGGYDQQSFGDAGGGYLNNTAMGTPGGSQERKSRQRTQNVLPVTLSEVLNCDMQDEKFLSNGVELHQVTSVGLVREVNETPTRIDYKIDDMTGPPLDVRQFVDNAEDSAVEEKTTVMRENTYVRIFGHVRSFNNKCSIVAFKIVPVNDMNELTNHMLETLHAHIYLTKGASAGASSSVGAPVGSYSGGEMNTMDQYSGGQPDQGLTPVQQQVYNVIRACQDEQGVSVKYICDRVKGLPQNKIRDAIEFLSGEGHIYSTIDDEHFKSTDGM